MFLPPATKLAQGYIFTGVCDSVHTGGVCVFPGGACVVARGGMHGCWGGGHAWLPGGCVWLPGGVHGCRGEGACVVAGGHVIARGMHGSRGHAWGGMPGCQGACMVARGHAWDTRYSQWVGGTHPTGMHSCYTCLWFCSQGGSAPLHAGIHTPQDQRQPPLPPGPGTPPGTRGRHPPGPDTPSAVHAGRYGQQAGGTHPTGMQSCLTKTIPPGTLSAAFQYKIVHFFHTLMYHNSQY